MQVLVPIGNGTEEMEAVIIIDILRRAGADVAAASVEDELQILASRNVKLEADTSISNCEGQTYDLVVLPVRNLFSLVRTWTMRVRQSTQIRCASC